MPEQEDGCEGAREPEGYTPPDTPIKPSGDQKISSEPATDSATKNAKATEKIAQEIKSGEKWLIGLQVITLFVTSYIGFIYWEQLQEMVGVSGQTDALTRAYRHQESDIQKLAVETHDLAISAGKQAEASKRIAESTKVQSLATKALADDAAKANRAWMGIDGKLILDSPISLTSNEGPAMRNEGVGATFHYTIKNFGKDPAFLVNARPVIVPVTQLKDLSTWEKEIIRLQELSCVDADKNTLSTDNPTGDAVFPENPIRIDMPFSFGFYGAPGYPILDPREPLTIVGCISYKDQYPSKVGILHHTRFCYATDSSISSLKKDDEFRHCTRFQSAD